jgi:hypothetical protein
MGEGLISFSLDLSLLRKYVKRKEMHPVVRTRKPQSE